MTTIEELESNLPNGFHDAMLVTMKVDYERAEVVLSVDADVCDPSMNNHPHYKRGELFITGLLFLAVDTPSSVSIAKPLRIDAGPGQPSTAPIELPSLPEGSFLHWFFVSDWNSFIRVAATNALWRWSDAT